MKTLILFFLTLFGYTSIHAQDSYLLRDTQTLPQHSIRAIATVVSAEQNMMTIKIEEVTAYSRGASITPMQGDEITVRLPGRNGPEVDNRIEVDLKEKIDVGALPSAYIMLDYETLNE